MPKFRVYGSVVASKYLGIFEADTKEQAEEMAIKQASVSVCHQCSNECTDPEIDEVTAEEVADGEAD